MDNLVTATTNFASEQRKCQFMQFVAPIYSRKKKKKFGFHIGFPAHNTANNITNNRINTPVLEPNNTADINSIKTKMKAVLSVKSRYFEKSSYPPVYTYAPTLYIPPIYMS